MEVGEIGLLNLKRFKNLKKKIDCRFILFLQSFLISIFSAESQTTFSYWQEITEAENYFPQKKYDSCVITYFNVFKKYGVKQLDNWYNAIYISETLANKNTYTDSLILLLQKENNLLAIKQLEQKFMSNNLEKLLIISDTITPKFYKVQIHSKKENYYKWKKIEKRDQIIRRFPISFFISNRKMAQVDSKNRDTLYHLYEANGYTLPNRLDFGKTALIEPYWVVFQHHNFDWKNEDTPEKFQNILIKELSKGSLSPKMVQYSLIYSVARDIDKRKIETVYEDSQQFIQDWFKVLKFNTLSELQKELSQDQLDFINNLRNKICMEQITDSYLEKRSLLLSNKLYVR